MSTRVRGDHWFQAGVAISTSLSGCDVIPVQEFDHLGFVVPTSGLTSLAYYGTTDASGTFYPLYNPSGGAVTQAVATGRYHAADPNIASVGLLKLVGNQTGVIDIFMKY